MQEACTRKIRYIRWEMRLDLSQKQQENIEVIFERVYQ